MSFLLPPPFPCLCSYLAHEPTIPSLINFPTAITTWGADPWVVPGKGPPLWEAGEWDELWTCSSIRGLGISSQRCPKLFLLLCIDMSGVALQGLLRGRGSCLCISEALDLCPLLGRLKVGDSVFPRAVARWQWVKTERHEESVRRRSLCLVGAGRADEQG